MKNYFTDSQVKELRIEAFAAHKYKPEENAYTMTIAQLKALMNLAVEVAIMEADIEGLNERLAKFDKENKPKPINLDIKYDI